MTDADFSLFLLQEQQGKKRKRQQQTAKLHIQALQRLRRHVPSLDPVAVSHYLLSLYEQERKGTYLNKYINTLKIYGRFLKTDIYDSLSYFPEDDYEKATMSDSEIEAFLQLSPPTITRINHGKTLTYTFSGKKWNARQLFWKCLAYSGARPGEIASLTVDSVDFGRQVFTVYGKTGKRIVPIAPLLIQELTEYLTTLTTDKLFPAMNEDTWLYDFHQRIKRLGIKRKNLTPYSLRHSFITRMLDEDINVFKVQDIVGHKQLETTRGYYHLTTKGIVKTISLDPLTRPTLPYNQRFILFRDNVRLLLKNYATSIVEEKKLLSDLLSSIT